MKSLYTAAAFAAITTITGCASTPKAPPVFSESFITNITEQGNRMFTYTATINGGGEGGGPGGGMGGGRRGPGGPGGGGGMGGGPGGGMGGGPGGGMGGGPGGGGMSGKMRENPEKAAGERLEEVLATTQYCPHGWFVIEKSNLQGSVEIRGECRAG
ncbi:hypothetical protein M0G74_03000 [Microbulbifer sp. CAU 1566]|uniref:hypothetical protein n=1 Tax=Microbulbifer sp. CAU 1566 TaxID=2933269 RepID=UPI0020029B9B|nr:hypothetical protein [Microbulbifer sp. CAU 1566]MCK7596233.1 hypothetical protein [Microbulbifer sp. CAU 1566]